MHIGCSLTRIDAFDKVTGKAQYTDDLCPRNALVARVLHASIANGTVLGFDLAEALQVDGVVKIITCFDVPDRPFDTGTHPWSNDPALQGIEDRHLLNRRVRYYGDDIAAVVATDEISAHKALSLIRVRYEESPPVPVSYTHLDVYKRQRFHSPYFIPAKKQRASFFNASAAQACICATETGFVRMPSPRSAALFASSQASSPANRT